MTPRSWFRPASGVSAEGDQKFEATLGRLLGIGVVASSMCLAAGLVMSLASGGSALTRGLLSAGLVLLMATPAARVAASAVSYARRRDWVFVVLTLVVFLQLLASVFVAFQR